MACFIVPGAEAVVTTIATKVVKSKENGEMVNDSHAVRIPFSTKLGWLNKLLIGGSGLLAFEHVWHGEVVASFPFLTAVTNGETSEMLAEMGSTGVLMALSVSAIWLGMVIVSSVVERRANSENKNSGEVVAE